MKNRKWLAHAKTHSNKVLKRLIRDDQKDSVRSYLLGKVRRWDWSRPIIRCRRKTSSANLIIVRLLKKKGADYYEYFAV